LNLSVSDQGWKISADSEVRRNGRSDNAVAVVNGVNRRTAVLCIRSSCSSGQSRRIPDDAITWVFQCACQMPKDLGYSFKLWTYALLQSHVRKETYCYHGAIASTINSFPSRDLVAEQNRTDAPIQCAGPATFLDDLTWSLPLRYSACRTVY
jgi:hypothetical protein